MTSLYLAREWLECHRLKKDTQQKQKRRSVLLRSLRDLMPETRFELVRLFNSDGF